MMATVAMLMFVLGPVLVAGLLIAAYRAKERHRSLGILPGTFAYARRTIFRPPGRAFVCVLFVYAWCLAALIVLGDDHRASFGLRRASGLPNDAEDAPKIIDALLVETEQPSFSSNGARRTALATSRTPNSSSGTREETVYLISPSCARWPMTATCRTPTRSLSSY